uniref:Cathepsin-like protein 2 n=1 Tax=Tigriopus japonicus TaxID=158387 RepID=A0A0H4KPG7_TIGJA|nr:cathepsin-like protein 2 [Tigriopus japonicus]
MTSRKIWFRVAIASTLVVGLIVGGCIVYFWNDHQCRVDPFLAEDREYIKSDTDHHFPDFDHNILACYEDNKLPFCKDLNVSGPWKTNDIIQVQNEAFKTKKSLFYCKPELLFPTGNFPIISDYELGEGRRITFKGPMRDLPDKAIEYVDSIINNKGEPPRDEFFTPKRLLTKVKHQGKCGSCVPFASVAAIETAFIHSNANLTNDLDLAEQTLVNCGIGEKNTQINGCKGVVITKYFEYLMKHRGGRLPLEKDDPYKDEYNADKCISDSSNFNANVSVTDFYKYHKLHEIKLKALVAMHGAVVSGIDVGKNKTELRTKFEHYGGGIFDFCPSTSSRMNHAVTIIGYGNANGTKYWVAKNSWGENWGEKGTFRIAFNCNRIAEHVVVPIVTRTNPDIRGINNTRRFSSEL